MPPPQQDAPIDRLSAFTLAEVLITLGVIGVVAAITMPALITNVTERVNSHRQANIAYKITQATDKMKAMGLLNGTYATTDQFVDELQKHLKIAKRCDAAHIAECWPTEKVITSDGKEFEVKNAKRGKNINVQANKSDNVGLVLADGASIILTYNQDSLGMDVGEPIVANKKSLPVGFGKSEEFAYTTNTTGAIDFVMDVNGKKGPNSETRDNKMKDIRSFKVARFSEGCDYRVPGIGCIVNIGTSYECIPKNSEEYNKWEYPRMLELGSSFYYGPSCWAGANKACHEIGMSLPAPYQISQLYRDRNKYPDLNLDINDYLFETAGTTQFRDDIGNSIMQSSLTYYNGKALCIGD